MRIEKSAFDFNIQQDNKSKNNVSVPFGDYLKDALDSANDLQINADNETQKLITGQSTDIHQALIAAEEARIQMELVVQVRNKLMDSYQEISRMQI
ncbi:MAG: flagellar hook-basal body complex protein FliE [Clostridiales bacterium]|nr:flagellar hook-basal body complex protein FliE [Clostridiales bacterium]HBM81513.1 flagellar hook-basal body complex protein FliE [Clostridiaceae bacterium]